MRLCLELPASVTLCIPSDLMGLKRMMEKLGVPKTHLELKKMIVEVTGGNSNAINYRDFVKMMLGKRSAVLKLWVITRGTDVPFTPKTPSMHVMLGGVSHLLCQPEINRRSCDDEQQCHYPHAALVVNLHSNRIHLCSLSIASPSLSWSGIMCLANWQETDYLPMVTQAWTEKNNTTKKWVIFALYSRNLSLWNI